MNIGGLVGFVLVHTILIGWIVVNILLLKMRNNMLESRVKELERDWLNYVLGVVDDLHVGEGDQDED